jgi:hypothetical protein
MSELSVLWLGNNKKHIGPEQSHSLAAIVPKRRIIANRLHKGFKLMVHTLGLELPSLISCINTLILLIF